MGAAMEQAISKISDAFRPERKEWQARINQACQLREFVTSHRYTFQDALTKLEARTDWMLEAFDCMALDNFGLNQKHGGETFSMRMHEITAWEWLNRIAGE